MGEGGPESSWLLCFLLSCYAHGSFHETPGSVRGEEEDEGPSHDEEVVKWEYLIPVLGNSLLHYCLALTISLALMDSDEIGCLAAG